MRTFASFFALLAIAGAGPADSRDMVGANLLDLQLVRIVGSGPAYFFSGDEVKGCPALTPRCRRRAYLVGGDLALAGVARAGLTMVDFVDSRGRLTEGWMASSSLMPVPGGAVASRDWIGTWDRDEAEIVITANGNRLHAEGQATWGMHDPDRVRRGGVNLGDFAGDVMPTGDRVAVVDGDASEEYACRVAMRIVAPYLVVADNLNCGGMNVSFAGIYRR